MVEPDYLSMTDFEARGIPYGRAAEVNLRNNHAQYIFTWYVSFHPPCSSELPLTCIGMLSPPPHQS